MLEECEASETLTFTFFLRAKKARKKSGYTISGVLAQECSKRGKMPKGSSKKKPKEEPEKEPETLPKSIKKKNTMKTYFAAAPVTSGVAVEEPPPFFATSAERRHTVRLKKGNKTPSKEICVSYALKNGTLNGGCHHCSRHWEPITRFAPTDATNSAANRQRFDAAYAAYRAAYTAGDKETAVAQRAIVEAHRTDECDSCRGVKKPTPKQKACDDEYNRMRKEMCQKHNGCQKQDCPERGMESWCVLTADHGTNPKKRDKDNNPVQLSNYTWWAANGGVEAMREEAKQIDQWICHCCHIVEPTGDAGRRVTDPKFMPKGKWNGTKEEIAQYKRRLRAIVVFPKQQHNDARKRAVKYCQYPGCGREVVEGKEPTHDWDHRVESTKNKGGLFGKNGGVAGLVQNQSKAATLEKVQPLQDAETDLCDLLCRNCHLGRKPRGIGRWEIFKDD